jgi:hypothetical protein
MSRWFLILTAMFVLAATRATDGQGRELGVVFGGVDSGSRELVPAGSGSADISTSFALEVAFDQRVINAHIASLYLELPVIVAPSVGVGSANVLLPRSYSSVFVAPGLKLKILPVGGFSPYLVLGGGLAHFSSGSTTQNDSIGNGGGATSAAYDFGGGLDMRVLPLIGIRVEVRDVSSGNPSFNVPVVGGRQHNVLFGAGIVLRF